MSKPIVAVVGRPNVGKSTLFNRLAGERISIVQDTPGVTRDRIYADCEWLDRKFTLIDTGGMEIGSEEIIQRQIIQQAQIAIETADVILFVTDVKTGVNAGVTSILVLSGETTLEDCEKSDVNPDYVLGSVKDILDAIK